MGESLGGLSKGIISTRGDSQKMHLRKAPTKCQSVGLWKFFNGEEGCCRGGRLWWERGGFLGGEKRGKKKKRSTPLVLFGGGGKRPIPQQMKIIGVS